MNDELSMRLRRIRDANQTPSFGVGVGPDHCVPFTNFHNRALAASFRDRLVASGLGVKVKTSRLYSSFYVPMNELEQAQHIEVDFRSVYADTEPRAYSSDYDVLIMCLLIAVTLAFFAFIMPGVSHLIPLGVLVTGFSLGVVGERCNRQYRYRRTRFLSLWDLVLAAVIGAANWAVWAPFV